MGNPLRSFDISWVAPGSGQYYLADRSNAGIDVIATDTLTFQRTITKGSPTGQCPTCKFVGIVLTTSGAVNNNLSGPDGVTQHGHWLYAGDGDSTLKVIDLNIAGPNAIVESVPTGGTTRLDDMALNPDGTLLLGANNRHRVRVRTLWDGLENVKCFCAWRAICSRFTSIPALVFHQAGRLSEAEGMYRQLLKDQPNHFDALHLLGVIHHQRGHHAEAVRHIDAALTINPSLHRHITTEAMRSGTSCASTRR